GVDRVVGERHPGELFGEVPMTLGTVFPVGFRAAGFTRVMRIEPQDYYVLAASSPELARAVGSLAANRIGGPAGLQGLAAEPTSPSATVIGHRWDAECGGLRRFLDRNQISFRWVLPDAVDAEEEWGEPIPPETEWPSMRLADGTVASKPGLRDVARLLGL